MIKDSELILNDDGSIFHLHLKPEHISDWIFLVGDPARVDTIAGVLERAEFIEQNREFRSATGWYNNKKFTVVSTGIGTDNIDIVLNELDALVNIDLEKREIKKSHKSLNIIRIGTSGGLQSDLPVNSVVISKKSIGFDGLLNFYDNRKSVCDTNFEKAFAEYTGWPEWHTAPYVVDASEELLSMFEDSAFKPGVTISAPGFYGPQGRVLRLPLAMSNLNRLIEKFSYDKLRITNYEMESSAIYGLSKLLGHNALTACLIIANRVTKEANPDYRLNMKNLIVKVLDQLTK